MTIGHRLPLTRCRRNEWCRSNAVSLETDTVVFEAKSGPYQPASEKDFATWAPAADTDEAGSCLAQLDRLFRESCML